MKTKVFLIFFAALFLTSCTETQFMVREKQIRTTEAQAGIITEPMILEVEYVSPQPIKDTTVFDFYEYNIHSVEDLHKALPTLKEIAWSNFCFSSGYDMIVNSTYHVFPNDGYSKLIIVVKGYGVKYKKLRRATQDDVWMSNFNNK